VYCGPPQFTLIGGTDWTVPGRTENEELTDDPFKLAVVVTVPEAVAAETLTANVAVVCPDATVTEAGALNVMPVAAAPSETTAPEAGAAVLNVTVHEADAGAVIEVGEQTIERMTGTVPGRTENEELLDDPFKLAVAVTVPEALAAETLTANVAVVCPDATVTEAGVLNVIPVAAAPSETTAPEAGAGALSVRLHEADAGAVIEAGEHSIELMTGTT
jgi:hypothetical protein